MPSYYVPILVMLLLLFILLRKRRHVLVKQIIKRNKTEDRVEMIELAKKFIGKECIIYAFDGHQLSGELKEVNGNALLIEKNGAEEAVNLEFVVRIREYPRNKNGKKKSLIID